MHRLARGLGGVALRVGDECLISATRLDTDDAAGMAKEQHGRGAEVAMQIERA